MSLSNSRLLVRQMSLQVLRMLGRNGCNYYSSVTTATKAAQALTTTDFPMLISPEYRDRCMENMRKLPPFVRPRKQPQSKREKSSASVLIALCVERDSNDISLLYTRRSRLLRRHSLQISFPGGIRDDTDASYIDCALRETEEEIGLPRDRIEVWGEGNVMHFPRGAAIMPVVGVVPNFHISELKLNWEEVEEALSVPLNSLLTPTATRHTQFRGGYSGPAFVVDQTRIWGITAYLTYVFLRCLLPEHVLPHALKTNIKFIRPYKLPPKTIHHHHVDIDADDQLAKKFDEDQRQQQTK
ncbi:nucleoside diphosphate-linked moiety X motif 8 [Scaptodrosophila lebanonensis]|uniref:Nucleoside diphosphate-linked moiety X motif 8 n=1 Tax=Drosophila lebanonensis TaxID=7225 RepID=A0A6J2TUZ3_DROLE|nr:nucleoside diphosphate-linked moiety X motif 8 [Scaptodrosophila lebanonensis]